MNRVWKAVLAGLVSVFIPALLLVPALFSPTPARANPNAACQLTWTYMDTPSVGDAPLQLYSMIAFSADDAWLGGKYGYEYAWHPIVFHWDGKTWLPIEIPGTSYEIDLLGATGPSDLWATDADRQILHWDGMSWTHAAQAPVYLPIGSSQQNAMLAPNDIWRVGAIWNGSFAQTRIEHWDGATWTRVPSPNLTDVNILTSLAAASPTDIWAFGFANGNGEQHGMIVHWDGAAWNLVPFDGPARTRFDTAKLIAADDVWVGGLQGDNANGEAFILHWDGSTWNEISSPHVAGFEQFSDLEFASPNDLWAVGAYWDNQGVHSLVEHWDSVEWKIVDSPDLGWLVKIEIFSSEPVWIFSFSSVVLKWNGTMWKTEPLPGVGSAKNVLNGVGVISANDVWAVGAHGKTLGDYGVYENVKSLTEHWDGAAWQVIPSPNIPGRANVLKSVHGAATNDVWVVGYTIVNSDTRALLMHWDGAQWNLVASPIADAKHVLVDVQMISSDDVWAVGYTGSDYHSSYLIMHWDGATWSIVPAPAKPDGYFQLYSISAVNAQDIWAAGDDILHWDGVTWRVVSDSPAWSIAARAPNDVWADSLHWDGNQWTDTHAAPVGSDSSAFSNLVALAPDDVYAVGGWYGYKHTYPMSQHWNGTAWSSMVTPYGGGGLRDVVAVSANELWAVGRSSSGGILHAQPPCIIPTPTLTPTPSLTPTPTPRPPHAPELLTPANGDTVKSRRPILDWSDVKRAQQYEIEITNLETLAVERDFVARSQYKTMRLKRETIYQWRVRACLNEQPRYACGEWSEPRQFKVQGKRDR